VRLPHFIFQAEDGIRDFHVTGVQTCALPILQMKNTLTKLLEENNKLSFNKWGSFIFDELMILQLEDPIKYEGIIDYFSNMDENILHDSFDAIDIKNLSLEDSLKVIEKDAKDISEVIKEEFLFKREEGLI